MTSQTPQTLSAYPSDRSAWFALILLILAVLLAFIDRQVLALLVEPVKADLSLTDTQIGLLQGPAFALFYALAALPLGWMVDSTNRRNLIIAGMVVWSAATIGCGLAPSFGWMFLARIGVGVGEACLIPAVFSLIPDLFRPDRRATAFGAYVASALLGASLAMIFGGIAIGWLDSHDSIMFGLQESWRQTFVVVGLPGFILAAAYFLMREPARQEVSGAGTGFAEAFAHVKRHAKPFAYAALGLSAIGALAQSILAWLPAILQRGYGLSPQDAAFSLGWVVAFASIAGGLLVSRLPRWFARWDPDRPTVTAAVAGSAAALAIGIAGWFTDTSLSVALVYGAMLLPAFAAYGLTPVLIQAMAPNEMRGRIVAVAKLLEYSAVSVVAVAVGMLSDMRPGDPDGLQWATALCLLLTAVAAVIGFGLLRRSVRNEVLVQR
ncbi:MFS transporter [uncultured Algimonas sp.]|uniref:MFS transporter n=1 Tax=uncultured Algimonas sp. TaxID=1547920 RepID=UPI00261EF703|nr:MFS transporter [uncultured Algimonas sp.]